MTVDEARVLLNAADVFFGDSGDEEETPEERQRWAQVINLNDAFYWGCADGELVADADLPEVGRLFRAYGMGGIYYWVAKRRGLDTVEFVDINRMIDYVRQEEQNVKDEPSSDKRAYRKITYILGV